MDNRNVFVAIALSMSVLLFWGAFFDTPKQQKNVVSQKQERNLNSTTNQITPDINQFKTKTTLSRKDAITQNDRVIIKNDNVEGSISLKGAVIDDLSFIKYKNQSVFMVLIYPMVEQESQINTLTNKISYKK